MILTIYHGGKEYPRFQAEHNAAKFAIPYALQVCQGQGLDVGCNRPEWAMPGAGLVDPAINPEYHADNLPEGEWDYIFSSHTLEHVPNWTKTLEYWHTKLRRGATLFLYIPDFSQTYWRPHFNTKHIHVFTPEIIKAYFDDQPLKWRLNFVSGVDLNNSFMAMAEKY